MAQHKTFSVATDVKVYFCDPHSPWQRGTNENTNRLLRQYLPKKMDLSRYTQSELDKIALRLNQRPRKTLEFHTPASKLQANRFLVQVSYDTTETKFGHIFQRSRVKSDVGADRSQILMPQEIRDVLKRRSSSQ